MKKSLSTMMKQLLTMCDVTLHSVYGGVFFVAFRSNVARSFRKKKEDAHFNRNN